MVAWLITWEWLEEKEEIAAILNYRTSPEKVREIVELLYVNEYLIEEEKIAYAKNKKNTPYPAEFERIRGERWLGRIFCGPNPFLYARMVDDLKIEKTSGKIIWKEREIPKRLLENIEKMQIK